MKNKLLLGIFALVVGLLQSQTAQAISIDPSYTTFGSMPEATFGGTGIPNNAVAISEFDTGQHHVKLGLTAHQRYSNPPLANDGAGNFGALTGGDAAHGQPGYGVWNFAYSININPDIYDWDPRGKSIRLYYDLNPAVGNDVLSYITIDPIGINGPTFDSQNSLNLGMMSVFGPGFNPTVSGEYDFKLALFDGGSQLGDASAITVHVNSDGSIPPTTVPDGGASAILLGLGFAGCMAYRKKVS